MFFHIFFGFVESGRKWTFKEFSLNLISKEETANPPKIRPQKNVNLNLPNAS
jgi:hypothetical protein